MRNTGRKQTDKKKSETAPPVRSDISQLAALSRRQFTQSVVAAIATLAASACHRGGSDSQHSDAESPRADSTVWDCVRDALKSLEVSPDNLAAQSKKVVATGDPARIAAWVANNITVLPAATSGSYAPTTALWGARATLRSGAGSARDRADLLAGLLEAAGYKTRVVSWKRPASITQEQLYRVHDLVFTPDLRLLAPLLERAQRSAQLQTGPDQDAANECRRLADALLVSADEQLLARARPIDTELPDRLPIVEYEREGVKGWAIAYGSSDVVTSSPEGLGGPAGEADVRTVKLGVAVAANPAAHSALDRTVPHEVLSAQWPVTSVAGRQVFIGFPPPGDPRPYLLGANPQLQAQRVAVARLQSSEALLPSDGAAVVQGARLSLAGRVGSPASGNTDRNDDRGSSRATAAAQRKTVTNIALSVSAAAYPTVILDLALSDAQGQSVSSLGEPDFTVTDEGKQQAISVVRNTAPEGIRVLVLYDTSGSIAESWGSPVRRAGFEAQLSKQLAGVASTSPYLLQVVGLSDTPSSSAWTAPNAEQIQSRLGSIGSQSDVWWALGETAPKSGASAVIVISDFASSAEDVRKVPDYQRNLKASGIRLAIMPIGHVDRDATRLIQELSGCEEVQNDATAAEQLGRFVEKQVKQAATVNYQLQYRAPDGDLAKRTVEVAVMDAPASAARAEYAVPPVTERVAQTGIAGIYLTIEMAGRTAVRTLAGVPLSYRGTVADTADQRAIDEATRALNGLHTIAFEPSQPTASAILDEGLTRLLTLEPVFEAGSRPMSELLPQILQVQRFEPTLGLLLEPVPDAGEDLGGAVPDGLRVMVIGDVSHGDGVQRSVDLLSEFNTWRGRSADAQRAFRAAFRRSLAGSVREGRLFARSAARDLSTGPWVWVPPFDDGAKIDSLSAVSKDWLRVFSDRYGGNVRLVTPQQSTGGAWVVDPTSGSVTAVDADGRGGAGCSIPDEGALTVALALLSIACLTTAPAEGSQGFLLCVGADTYGAATTAAASFNTPAPDTNGPVFGALIYGAQLGASFAFAGAGPQGALARGLIGVILAMLSIATAVCPGNQIIGR